MSPRRMLANGMLALGLIIGAGMPPAGAQARAATTAATPQQASPDTGVDAAVAVPAWTGPVMDQAGVLTPEQIGTLTGQVRALEKTHGSQLFVLLVPTTGGESIEQYARRVFDQWGVGRKGIDDGVLLLVAVRDRRLRIDVGYGLEGAVTDVDAGRIIREQITPRFAQGDVYGGVEAGVSALSGLIAGEPLPPPASPDDGEGLDERVMFLPLTFFALVMTPPIGALLMGGFVFVLTESLLWAGLGALAGLALGILGRVLGIPDRLARGRGGRGGRGGGGGFGGGFGGGGGGGFGGGGGGSSGGGGGGRGGGGGASGGW
ncbi:TPM domain-containing protein [Castellaniella ginsengisoli]